MFWNLLGPGTPGIVEAKGRWAGDPRVPVHGVHHPAELAGRTPHEELLALGRFSPSGAPFLQPSLQPRTPSPRPPLTSGSVPAAAGGAEVSELAPALLKRLRSLLVA